MTETAISVPNHRISRYWADVFPPVAICKSDSVNLSAGGTVLAICNWRMDNGSFDQNDCGPITYKFRTAPMTYVDSLSFSCAQLGNNVVSFVAVDVNGNASLPCLATIKVKDVVAPMLQNIPANDTINCQDAIPTVSIPTATDACSNPIITFVQISTQDTVGCGQYNYMITRTWTAVDGAGNVSTGTQKITVQDIVAPQFVSNT